MVGWSCQGRELLVRIPSSSERSARMELRSPDPSCNPYLALTLVLEAGMDGIRQKLPLMQEGETIMPLPGSLAEAADAAKSKFIEQALPQELIALYLEEAERAQAGCSDDRETYYRTHYFRIL